MILVIVAVGVGVIAVGAAMWLNKRGAKEQAGGGQVAQQPAGGVAPAPVDKSPEPAPSETKPAGEAVAAAAVAAAPAAVDKVERPKPRRVQDRAVPLAKLPAEIYQRAGGNVETTTRRGGLLSFGNPGGRVAATGPKVADPLAAARERLAKDAGLREWFDQWQVDVAAERPTSAARVAELRSLLEKTSLGAEDLKAVADAVTKAEGETSDVARAWRDAAAKGR
jgi:hypothetical protein